MSFTTNCSNVIGAVMTAAWLAFAVGSSFAADSRPGPIPVELRDRLKLDDFYQKHVDVGGLPVLGSAKVSDNALCEAAWIVRQMLAGRDDILKAMAGQNVRAVVMAKDEFTTDVPEHARPSAEALLGPAGPRVGGDAASPVVSGAEENLLNFRRDPYPDENIFLHEFAHAIHSTGLNKVDPSFDERLKTAYFGRERSRPLEEHLRRHQSPRILG